MCFHTANCDRLIGCEKEAHQARLHEVKEKYSYIERRAQIEQKLEKLAQERDRLTKLVQEIVTLWLEFLKIKEIRCTRTEFNNLEKKACMIEVSPSAVGGQE